MSATRTATMVLNTATVTLTPQPTATVTHTPTTTLDPFEIDELGFPVILLTGSRTPQNTTNPDYLTPASPIVEEVPTESSRYLYVIVIAVWLVLAAFIVIFIRRIKRNDH